MKKGKHYPIYMHIAANMLETDKNKIADPELLVPQLVKALAFVDNLCDGGLDNHEAIATIIMIFQFHNPYSKLYG